MLNAGTIVADRYQIISKLGDGGMGSVYKASQLGLERIIALKILHQHLIEDTEHQERFEREGKILARLSHQNLMFFYEFGFWNDKVPFIAMEFLAGSSFKTVIGTEERIPWQRSCKIAIQVCEALAYAHTHGIIHRDLSPANIMLLDDPIPDFVKVVDFGLARAVVGSDSEIQKLTRTGTLMGSPHYMSPEQCQGMKVNSKSDIYSLGCILYEAVAGVLPFDADSAIGLIHKHINEDAPRLELSRLKVPAELEAIIFKALERDQDKRYQTMEEMQADLQHLLKNEHEKISAPALSKSSRKKMPVALTAVLIASLLITAAVLGFGFLTDPGFAAPIAGLLRGINSGENDKAARKYGKWLEEQNKLRGAEMIYTSILSRADKSSLSQVVLTELWFRLARIQFKLTETNLGCRSLVKGLQSLMTLPRKKIYEFGPEVESLIRTQFLSVGLPPTDPALKQTLKKLAYLYAENRQVSVSGQLWKLNLFRSKKGVETQVSQCCQQANDLRNENRLNEGKECLKVAEDLIEKSKHLNKPWLVRLHCELANEWFDFREYEKSTENTQKAIKLISQGVKADLGTSAALNRCMANQLFQSDRKEEGLGLYRDAYLQTRKLEDRYKASAEMLAVYANRLCELGKYKEARVELSAFMKDAELNEYNLKNYIACRLLLINTSMSLGDIKEAQNQLDLLDKEIKSEAEDAAPHNLYMVRLRLACKKHDWDHLCRLLIDAEKYLPEKHRAEITTLNPDLLELAEKNRDKVPWDRIRVSCQLKSLEPIRDVAAIECASNLYEAGKMTQEKKQELLINMGSDIMKNAAHTGVRKAEITYVHSHILLAAKRLSQKKKYADLADLIEFSKTLPDKDKSYHRAIKVYVLEVKDANPTAP